MSEFIRIRPTDKRPRRAPFTDTERLILDHIACANRAFAAMPRQHPSELDEWLGAVHRLQELVGYRVLQREYQADYPQFIHKKTE